MQFIRQTVEVPDVVVSCSDAGKLFTHLGDDQQREFLLGIADGVEEIGKLKGSWPMQCRAITDGSCGPGSGLSQADRIRISVALSTLMEHLDEPVR